MFDLAPISEGYDGIQQVVDELELHARWYREEETHCQMQATYSFLSREYGTEEMATDATEDFHIYTDGIGCKTNPGAEFLCYLLNNKNILNLNDYNSGFKSRFLSISEDVK